MKKDARTDTDEAGSGTTEGGDLMNVEKEMKSAKELIEQVLKGANEQQQRDMLMVLVGMTLNDRAEGRK